MSRFLSRRAQSLQTKFGNRKSGSGFPNYGSRGFNLWANASFWSKMPLITLVDECFNLMLATESVQIDQPVRQKIQCSVSVRTPLVLNKVRTQAYSQRMV